MSDRNTLLRELEMHRREEARIREQLSREALGDWRPPGFYLMYHLMAGVTLGGIGAAASLLWNVLGATLMLPEEHPLYIIQVYLTFGMGEAALSMEPGANRALLLFAGSILYLATGGLFGVLLHLMLAGWMSGMGAALRGLAALGFGAALWLVNFKVLLPWLQPQLFGGNWIAELTPWYVGLSTHLVFAAVVFLLQSWGRFDQAREFAAWDVPAGPASELGAGESISGTGA